MLLAASPVLLSPLRFGMLWSPMALLPVVSVVLFAALITISIALIAPVITRHTLPAADRMEQRQTRALPG